MPFVYWQIKHLPAGHRRYVLKGKSITYTEPLFSFDSHTADGCKRCTWFRKVKAVVLKTKK